MAEATTGKVRVFISYSHKDEDLKKELIAHLALLRRQDLIALWHDRMIRSGDRWMKEISDEIEGAHVILLLISSDFLNSDFCYYDELGRAMERSGAGHARVIWILVRACEWQGAPFAQLQGLPTGLNPVKSWDDRDEAWTDVARGVRGAVVYMQGNIAQAASGADIQAAESPRGERERDKVEESNPRMSLRLVHEGDDSGMRSLQIEVAADPPPAEGYIGIQTQLYYGALTYLPAEIRDEIVWPDSGFPLRSPGAPAGTEALVSHASATSIMPPFPRSAYSGTLIKLALRCDASDSERHVHEVLLIGLDEANTSAAGFKTQERVYAAPEIRRQDIPGVGTVAVAASLQLACGRQ